MLVKASKLDSIETKMLAKLLKLCWSAKMQSQLKILVFSISNNFPFKTEFNYSKFGQLY